MFTMLFQLCVMVDVDMAHVSSLTNANVLKDVEETSVPLVSIFVYFFMTLNQGI